MLKLRVYFSHDNPEEIYEATQNLARMLLLEFPFTMVYTVKGSKMISPFELNKVLAGECIYRIKK